MIYKHASITQLKKKKGKCIYCYGAGRAFDNFIKEFKQHHLEKNMKAVVDSHAETLNISCKNVNNADILIISLDQMLMEITEDDCILITTAAYEEIIRNLEQISKLNTIEYYLYSVLRAEQYDYERLQILIPEKLSSCHEFLIPKTIHYCWFGKNKIPDQYKQWMESWKRYCPDYEIIEWNETNYDVHKSRYCSQAYERKKWAYVSDYARIDLINEYGGIYLDTDVELIKNIDKMLKNEAFCGFESSQYVAYGLGFGAVRNHPVIEDIKNYYDSTQFILEDGTLNQVNCPVIQTEVMKRHGLVCNGEFQIVNGMAVYPERILCGMSSHSYRLEKNPVHTYAVHHFDGSWMENKKGKQNIISYMKKGKESKYYYYPE